MLDELTKPFGSTLQLEGKIRVQTTFDADFQRIAEETVSKWHTTLETRGLGTNQIALVAIDPRTHFIKALVGRVLDNPQVGSTFKPFVYYTAFTTGKFSPDSTVVDAPVNYRNGNGWYSPRNYDGNFRGAMPIRTALVQSRNIPVIKIGKAVGMNRVIETCRTLGIVSPMEPVTSLPLGAIGVTPLEMASAYATFANYGWQSPPTVIARVTDSSGNVLLDNTPKPQLVLNPWASAAIIDVMQSVITDGEGKNATIGRPAAGMTEITVSEKDIWFVGTVPQLTTAVWIGRKDNIKLAKNAINDSLAAFIWRDFMQQALKDLPVENFKQVSQFPRPKSDSDKGI